MVSLMDRLLKLENLDLHLTPYRVLATGHDEGMLEFIPSKSLAQVLHASLQLLGSCYLVVVYEIVIVILDQESPYLHLQL